MSTLVGVAGSVVAIVAGWLVDRPAGPGRGHARAGRRPGVVVRRVERPGSVGSGRGRARHHHRRDRQRRERDAAAARRQGAAGHRLRRRAAATDEPTARSTRSGTARRWRRSWSPRSGPFGIEGLAPARGSCRSRSRWPGTDDAGRTDHLADAIRYAADHGAKIINMSLGEARDPDDRSACLPRRRASRDHLRGVQGRDRGGRGRQQRPDRQPGRRTGRLHRRGLGRRRRLHRHDRGLLLARTSTPAWWRRASTSRRSAESPVRRTTARAPARPPRSRPPPWR